jgi:chloramphenicol-sensitive protein RarD
VSEQRRGLTYGVAAYLLWGLFPLYWPLLEPAGADEILAHRIVWSLVVVAALLVFRRRWAWIRELGMRRLGLLTLAAVLVAGNWLTYIYGVNNEQIVQTSLGYFTNPLVTVLLGVFVLGERLRRLQWAAVAVATAAVGILTIDYGGVPWIALMLAFSFAAYGLVKKKAGVGPVESLSVETAVLVGPAAAYLFLLSSRGDATAGDSGPWHLLLLAGSGVVTAIPLLCFGAAAIRIPLSSLGLLQYLAPGIQLAIGVFVFSEPMPPSRLAGFALVWVGLVLLTVDGLTSARRRRAPRELAPEPV